MRHRKKVVSQSTKVYKYGFQKHTKEEANQRTNLKIGFYHFLRAVEQKDTPVEPVDDRKEMHPFERGGMGERRIKQCMLCTHIHNLIFNQLHYNLTFLLQV